VIQACLNGARAPDEHPALPVTPEALASDAAAAVAAGARSLHVHPRDESGAETLAPAPVAAAVRAIRAAVPRVELSLSTGLWIAGPGRMDAIAGWTDRPDLCSVNVSEAGWEELVALLTERGIEVEAGVSSVEEAAALADSGLVETWGRGSRGGGRRHRPVRRILVEPDGDDQVALAAAIENALTRAAVPTNRLYHGFGPETWAVLDAAGGHDIRIGLEDVLVLPDGSPAPDNTALVAAAVARYGA
jgi:uncharacterized protein (DUF849 family)